MATMFRPSPLAAALLVAAACSVVAPVRAGDGADDPIFEGKTFAAWAKDLVEGDADTSKAAQAVLRRAGKAAVPTLAELVDGKSRLAAGFACDALASLGVDAAPAVPALIRCLGVEGVEWSAERALEKVGEPAAAPLGKALADPKANVFVRAHAARILGRLGKGAAPGLDAVLAAAGDKDFFVREEASRALGTILLEPARSVAALSKAVAMPDPGARAAAAEALGRFGPEAAPAEAALLRIAGDSDALVRAAAWEALARTGDAPGAVGPVAISALDDDVAEVRVGALKTIGARGVRAEGLANRVLELSRTGWFMVRRAAAGAFHAAGVPAAEAMPVLGELLLAPDLRAVVDAIDAIGSYGAEGAPAVPALVEDRLLAHPDAGIRFATARALGAMGPAAKDALPRLRARVDEPDPAAREAIAAAIRAIGG